MITCENIYKQYGRQVVLTDFSYQFSDSGFYLLYGESGSGKTTLINILSGMLPFDKGRITVNTNDYDSTVDLSCAGVDFDYITQDTFFADFLTVTENLRLISEDEKKIGEVLQRFGLSETGNQYPTTLSGGERQRLAIARAYLAKKKVLFLDEPTASLDEANKKAVFALLSDLKKDTLIICSSHDAVAKSYADETILFQKCSETRNILVAGAAQKASKKHNRHAAKQKSTHIIRYLRKWFTSKKRNRRSEGKFCVFLTLAIMLIMLGDIPAHKQAMNYQYSYRVNALVLKTHAKDATDYASLTNMPGVKNVVLSYAGSTPIGIDYDNIDSGSPLPMPVYETSLYTLPFDAKYFKLADNIQYGGYFTSENQVLLSYEEAEMLSPGDHNALIGRTLTKNVYSLGDIKFEIVGVMGKLNDFEKKYLLSLDMDHDSMYFNSKFTERFINDSSFYMGEQRTYYIFFDSYGKLSAFYDEYYDTFMDRGEFLSLGSRLNHANENNTMFMLGVILVPLSIFVAIFTELFYSNLLKTEIAYNNHFIAVFEYAGYSKKKVILCFVLIHMLRLLLMSALSFVIAFIITEAINALNRKLVFIGFQLFTLNPVLMVAFVFLLVVFSLLSAYISLHRLKISSWYDSVIRQRDLL